MMKNKIVEIDPDIAKEAREQADFLLAELKARNPDSQFPKDLLEGLYSALYSVKNANKKLKQK